MTDLHSQSQNLEALEPDDELMPQSLEDDLADGEIPPAMRALLAQEAPSNHYRVLSMREGVLHLIRAMPQDVLVMMGVGLAVLLVVMMLIAPTFTLLMLLFGAGAIFYVLTQGEEITSVSADTGILTRVYQLGALQLYRVDAEKLPIWEYRGDLPRELSYPPSVGALLLEPEGEAVEAAHAAIILQTTLLALWAWDLIELGEIKVNHRFVGMPIYRKAHRIVTVGSQAAYFRVDGDLERSVLLFLRRWPNMNYEMAQARPWLQGPDLRHLVAGIQGTAIALPQMGSGVLQLVQGDAIGRGLAVQRGWRKKFDLLPEAMKALQEETHAIQLLAQDIMRDYPGLIGMIYEDIAAVFEVKWVQIYRMKGTS